MNSLRSPFTALVAALCLAAYVGTAQDTSSSGQSKSTAQTVSPTISNCTAVLRDDYVEAVKPASFLDGNKLTGKLLGFESDFVVFSIQDGKQAVYVPKAAILYLIGKERHVTF